MIDTQQNAIPSDTVDDAFKRAFLEEVIKNSFDRTFHTKGDPDRQAHTLAQHLYPLIESELPCRGAPINSKDLYRELNRVLDFVHETSPPRNIEILALSFSFGLGNVKEQNVNLDEHFETARTAAVARSVVANFATLRASIAALPATSAVTEPLPLEETILRNLFTSLKVGDAAVTTQMAKALINPSLTEFLLHDAREISRGKPLKDPECERDTILKAAGEALSAINPDATTFVATAIQQCTTRNRSAPETLAQLQTCFDAKDALVQGYLNLISQARMIPLKLESAIERASQECAARNIAVFTASRLPGS